MQSRSYLAGAQAGRDAAYRAKRIGTAASGSGVVISSSAIPSRRRITILLLALTHRPVI